MADLSNTMVSSSARTPARRNFITTHTIVPRSSSRTVREIKARHHVLEKF
jgi:fructose-1,6-bisphosphatase/sedoheptulose 1,7-bisphosphatase-like protein